MTDPAAVALTVRDTLTRMPLAETYSDEQRDLQPAVQAALQPALLRAFPDASLQTIISVGGTDKPNLKLLGTSFWPDVAITEVAVGLVAIEVKLIRAQQPASKALAEAIGQSLIYSIRYPRVFAFVVHYGRSDSRYHTEDADLDKRLAPFNIELILRRQEPGVGPFA